ncbi:uncharacterized protein FRV6_14236 [Fusarium oxysporum]|uniref:Uncharacterized protein n=1 Tax=Fusarium oxysporum TaxID=5507 RepID=A0A2H3TN90_FUSOX|nr:uncharacterized protein FRV6_14236 [Fusarium oxysporum]
MPLFAIDSRHNCATISRFPSLARNSLSSVFPRPPLCNNALRVSTVAYVPRISLHPCGLLSYSPPLNHNFQGFIISSYDSSTLNLQKSSRDSHDDNQRHGDGDFPLTHDQLPVHQPAYPNNTRKTDLAYSQCYTYQEGLVPSAPAPITHYGSIGFMKSKWPACFMVISLLQAALCICFEAFVFAKFQSNVRENNRQKMVQSQYKTITTFLALFIFSFLYTLVVVWDALCQKNTIQIIGICFSNFALMVYTTIQVSQTHRAINILAEAKALDQGVDSKSLWDNIRPFLVAIPTIIAVATIAVAFVAWKIYREYAWDIWKNIGADYHMKKRFLHYQIYIALLKFDFFFFLGFIIQLTVVVVSPEKNIEFAATIASIPIIVLILLSAAYYIRKENKFGMVIVIILYLGGLAYFIFKLVRIYQHAYKQSYFAVRKSLTAFAIITILLILITIINAVICLRNFGAGLKPYLNSKRKIDEDEKLDLNSISRQGVEPQIRSRMMID